jgi:hypothetical protein
MGDDEDCRVALGRQGRAGGLQWSRVGDETQTSYNGSPSGYSRIGSPSRRKGGFLMTMPHLLATFGMETLKWAIGGRDDRPTLPAVLGWVNQARRAAGLPALDRLPAGRPRDPKGCPLARAVPGLSVYPTHCQFITASPNARWIAGAWATELAGDGRLELPAPLHAFVRAFDAGCYPELVEN